MAECPECGAALMVAANIEAGEIMSCPDCGVELEVVTTNPVVVELAPQEGEDWGE